MRKLSYDNTDVFLIVYSAVDSASFDNALNKVKLDINIKWYPELNKDNLANIPKIIVGNKIDMRDESNSKHIRKETVIYKII